MDKIEGLFVIVYDYGYFQDVEGPFTYEQALDHYTIAVQTANDVRIAKLSFLD